MKTHKDVQEYYDTVYYSNVNPNRPTPHYEIYLNYLRIKNNSGKSLLDVACGTGKFIDRALMRGLRCSGIDISTKAIEFAKKRYPNCDLRVGASEQLPWANASFDYVTCLGSLEHFLDMDLALKEMVRVCRPDARMLIMVPNIDYPYTKGTEQKDIKETLLSLDGWKTVLESNGLYIDKIYPDRWPARFIALPKKNLALFAKNLYIKIRIWYLPLDMSYQIVFICSLKKK